MKPNKWLLSIVSIALASAPYAVPSLAYGKDKAHEEVQNRNESNGNSKDKRKEEREDRHEDLVKGIPHPVTLTNLSGIPLKEIEITFSGKDRRDFRQNNTCGEELKGRSSCTINVTFLPSSPGAKTALMEVHTSGGNQIVYLSGTGI